MQSKVDTTKSHVARVYDYFLGGKDNFAVDRHTAEETLRSFPAARTSARENRAFLGRTVRYLAAEAGVRQFLDIGTGLPSANNVHEVAQAIAPECRVVYVDNDPLVLAHARALLTASQQGRVAFIQADLREPGTILADPAVRQVLDLSKPVALMLVAVLHFLTDEDGPAQVVAALLDALAPGSYLAASHATGEYDPATVTGAALAYRAGGITIVPRSSDEFAELAFRGLEMVPPGLVMISDWRPDNAGLRPLPAEVNFDGAVARKP